MTEYNGKIYRRIPQQAIKEEEQNKNNQYSVHAKYIQLGMNWNYAPRYCDATYVDIQQLPGIGLGFHIGTEQMLQKIHQYL